MERELKVGEIVTIDNIEFEIKQYLNSSCKDCYFNSTSCTGKKNWIL